MSAIATFHLMAKASVDGLKTVAVGQLAAFLDSNAREVVQYDWSGWVFGTLLTYLDEERNIDLTKSSFDDLCALLTSNLGATCFVLTHEHLLSFESKLDPHDYREAELRDYYNDFNETDEPDAGRPMLDGIRSLRDALRQIDDKSIVLLRIG